MAVSAKAAPLLPLYTPNKHFFHSMTPQVPRLNADTWSLTIGGLVTHPVTWSYADLRALPMTEIAATLLCAVNEVGGERIGNARWRGVAMNALLQDIELAAETHFIRLESGDGHVTGLDYAQLKDALIAFEMNDYPLTAEQGFPARLIVPGLYDYKMPRWIERIEFTTNSIIGQWEKNGYPLDGNISTTAAITSHRAHETVSGNVALEGYAFAGDRAIASVEISVDGSAWTAIPFTPGTRWSWSRWSLDWQPASVGDHAISIRATDANGQVQTTAHTVVLRVTA